MIEEYYIAQSNEINLNDDITRVIIRDLVPSSSRYYVAELLPVSKYICANWPHKN